MPRPRVVSLTTNTPAETCCALPLELFTTADATGYRRVGPGEVTLYADKMLYCMLSC